MPALASVLVSPLVCANAAPTIPWVMGSMNVLLTTMNLGWVTPKRANLAKELVLVLWRMVWKIKNKGKVRPHPEGCDQLT